MGTVLSDYEGGHGRGLTWVAFLAASMLLLMAFSVIPLPSQDFAENTLEVLMLEHMEYHSDVADMEEELAEILEEDEDEEQSDTPDIAALVALFEDVSATPADALTADMLERAGTPTDVMGELNIAAAEALGAFGRRDLDLTTGLITRGNAQGTPSRTLNSSLIAQGSGTELSVGLGSAGEEISGM